MNKSLLFLFVLIFFGCSAQSPTDFRVKIDKPDSMDELEAREIVLAVLEKTYRFEKFSIRIIPEEWKEWCIEASKTIVDLASQCTADYVVEPPFRNGSLSQFYVYKQCNDQGCMYISATETAIEE